MTRPVALSCSPSVVLYRNVWADLSPQIQGHYILEQSTRASSRLSFWPCHRMTVKNPVNSGQGVEQVLPAPDCVCSRPLARLALFSLIPTPTHPELLKNELRVDLQRTQPVAGLQTRTWKEKGVAMRRKWVHSKMMGNHRMGHGFQGCYFCQHPRSLVLHKPTNPDKKSKGRGELGKNSRSGLFKKKLALQNVDR